MQLYTHSYKLLYLIEATIQNFLRLDFTHVYFNELFNGVEFKANFLVGEIWKVALHKEVLWPLLTYSIIYMNSLPSVTTAADYADIIMLPLLLL